MGLQTYGFVTLWCWNVAKWWFYAAILGCCCEAKIRRFRIGVISKDGNDEILWAEKIQIACALALSRKEKNQKRARWCLSVGFRRVAACHLSNRENLEWEWSVGLSDIGKACASVALPSQAQNEVFLRTAQTKNHVKTNHFATAWTKPLHVYPCCGGFRSCPWTSGIRSKIENTLNLHFLILVNTISLPSLGHFSYLIWNGGA